MFKGKMRIQILLIREQKYNFKRKKSISLTDVQNLDIFGKPDMIHGICENFTQ